MAKTYIPTLVRILRRVCIYITKYRQTIEEYTPTGGKAALDGIMTACEVFLDLVGAEI
jgi:hypothetical protein